jgi:AraC-like DNA-binding protein
MHRKSYLYKRIVKAKHLIDNGYTTDLSVEKIAGEACFSKFHFLRLFRRAYNMTPHQYLISLRVRKARELLASHHSVKDTCVKVGFASTSSFIHLFSAVEKCTPSVYAARMVALKKDQAINPLNHVPQCFAEYMHWRE